MEIKCQLNGTEVFIADLIACSTYFGHHYAHYQELKSIIQWLLPVVFRAMDFQVAGLVWSWGLCVRFAGCCSILQTGHIPLSYTPDQQLENYSTKYHRQQPLYNTLELLMMGIVMPETCWASNKICNKNLCCIQLAFYFHILSSPFSSDHNFTDFPKGEGEKQHTGGRNSWCPRPSACLSERNGHVLKKSDKKKVYVRFCTTFSRSLATSIELEVKEYFARSLQILKS